MTTATLTYSLPEDREDLDDALHGSAWRRVAWDLSEELRRRVKYEDSLSEVERRTLEAVRSALHEIAEEHGLAIE